MRLTVPGAILAVFAVTTTTHADNALVETCQTLWSLADRYEATGSPDDEQAALTYWATAAAAVNMDPEDFARLCNSMTQRTRKRPVSEAEPESLTEAELDAFFRQHTIEGNRAAAIKRRFTVPEEGTAYLGTIHGYPDNLSVCEDLITPYNEDPSLTVIPGGTYYCELLE